MKHLPIVVLVVLFLLNLFSISCSDTNIHLPNEYIINDAELIRYIGDETELILPEGIVSIGEDAFAENQSLTTISIPSSVVVIHKRAFYNCVSLEKVELSAGLRSIEDWAFDGCYKINEFIIPDTVTKLGYACLNNTGIKELYIPASVKELSTSIINDNDTLTKLSFSEGITMISGFENCVNLNEVILPSSLREIEADCFNGCTKLKQLEIPIGVNNIGVGALYNTALWNNNNEKFWIVGDGILLRILTDETTVTLPDKVKQIAAGLESDLTLHGGEYLIFSPNLSKIISEQKIIVHSKFINHDPEIILIKPE